MIKTTKLIEAQYDYYHKELETYRDILKEYSEYDGCTLHVDTRKDGSVYYSVYSHEDGERKRKFQGRNSEIVTKLKERQYVEAYIEHLEMLCESLNNLPPLLDHMRPLELQERTKILDKHPIRYKTADELAWLAKMEALKKKHPSNYAEPKNRATRNLNSRSKSEALCISKLEEYGIAYIFECPIYANGKYRYPDFLIYINGKIFIWEHLGKIYDEEYYRDQFEKIQDYASIGYYIGTNLFLTCDMPDSIIDVMTIENVILSMINLAYA